jgi:hypothetical protein
LYNITLYNQREIKKNDLKNIEIYLKMDFEIPDRNNLKKLKIHREPNFKEELEEELEKTIRSTKENNESELKKYNEILDFLFSEFSKYLKTSEPTKFIYSLDCNSFNYRAINRAAEFFKYKISEKNYYCDVSSNSFKNSIANSYSINITVFIQ